jgi:ABC-type transport system substrate-binding protein
VPPAIWPAGFSPEIAYGPDRARALLDEAGYADRADLGAIVVNGTGLGVEPAVATWRAELGVEITVEVMDFGAFLDQLDTTPPGIFTISWIADYPRSMACSSSRARRATTGIGATMSSSVCSRRRPRRPRTRSVRRMTRSRPTSPRPPP